MGVRMKIEYLGMLNVQKTSHREMKKKAKKKLNEKEEEGEIEIGDRNLYRRG